MAAREHVKVALNGDGGDESFAGYPWNRAIRVAEMYHRFVPRFLRRSVLAPCGATLARVAAADGPLRSFCRLMAEWSDIPAADLFWIWPGFRATDLVSLCTPSFRSQLINRDPAAYCHARYEGADEPRWTADCRSSSRATFPMTSW